MIDDMTLPIDDTGLRIARRIRLERSARGWSLADLAKSSGVAKATISKIEREEMSPTAVTLVRLAAAFDLTLAGLLVRAEGNGDRLSRGRRSTALARSQDWLSPEASIQQSGPPSGDRSGRSAGRTTGRVAVLVLRPYPSVVWVLVGDLVIVEGGSGIFLGAGDCLGFGPPSEVTWRMKPRRPVTYLVVLART